MSAAFSPKYLDSHAIVVGVDAYEHCPPLGYAVSDATAVYDTLCSRFGFSPDNVTLLVDSDATRQNILDQYLHFATSCHPNDRLVFFFAGHGHTLPSYRGDVGFLVPFNGNTTELATLIRWDELTRNADLISAKHILFVMDACYGGLAIQRSLRPGAMRFLNDMLIRKARQVITAGKADETVADSGGPRPNWPAPQNLIHGL